MRRPVTEGAGQNPRTPAVSIGALLLAATLVGGSTRSAAAASYWQGAYYIQTPYYFRAPDDLPPPVRRPRRHHRAPHPKKDAAEELAARTAAKPQGPLILAISIRDQRLHVYDANGLFAEAPVSTGMAGHPTPMGIFSVIQKHKWHRSNIYSGAPMPYMQRITWSGVALHAGVLPGYPASHGCIRMPNSFAIRLWHWTRLGARVLVTPDEVAPADISHPFLIAHAIEPATTAAVDAAKTEAAADAAGLRLASAAADEKPVIADAETAPPAETRPAPKRTGPVAVFVSRKDRKVYVRQNFEPLFEAPATIVDYERPVGTYVFTAHADPHEPKDFRWSVVSLPSARPTEAATRPVASHRRGRRSPVAVDPVPVSTAGATEALDRLVIDTDVRKRIAAAITPGSSIIISDQPLAAGETGEGTEFVLRLH